MYSRDNLPGGSSTEIKDGAYIINLDEYSDIGTHWVALHVNNNNINNNNNNNNNIKNNNNNNNSNNVTYFNSFGVEHIPKEIKTTINCRLSSVSQNKNIKTIIFRIRAYDSIMWK